MRAVGAPQKLRFTIISCTGEDADYPVRELLYHSPQTRGWQTPRWCKYPQEILFKLEFPCKVQQVQLLSHEYKIATKVELFILSPGEDPNKAHFKRLGYLSFDSNERSNHQARELKSVHVNIAAQFIKLVIHRCHVNKLNIYNQCGLIALNFIGEQIGGGIDMPPGGYLQLHPQPTREGVYYNAAAADVADINLDIHVDSVTASKIRELAQMKAQAVANEEYDEAKRIKASIDRLKVVGQKIAQLEARKRVAVEKEDYDTAKLLKADIDKLRATGESAAGIDAPKAGQGKSPEEIFNRVLRAAPPGAGPSNVYNSIDEMPIRGGAPPPPDVRASIQEEAAARSFADDGGAGAPPLGMDPSQGAYRADGGVGLSTSFGGPGSGGGHYTAYDERPAVGRGRYTPGEDPSAAANARPPPPPPGGGGGGGGASDIPAPPGWPTDLPGPEPLAGQAAKDNEALEEVAGEFVARAFGSKNWQLREAALNYLQKLLREGSVQDKRDAFRTLTRVAQKAMKDKVANVFLASLSYFSALIDGFASAPGGKDIQSACDAVLPILIEKLGDSNKRLGDAAKESIMFIAGLQDAGLKSSTHMFTKPIKNQSAWKPVLGILLLLQDLVPLLGIGKGEHDGFGLQDLMEFVGKAYNSPNAECRAAAVAVTKEVNDLVGPALRKFLPKDINPKIKEQVDAVLGGEAAPAPTAAAAPPARAAPSARAGKGGGGGGGASKPPPVRASGQGPVAPAAGGKGKSAAAPPPPPPPPAAPDDPVPFEQELAAREQQLGPNHPDVAEACSNLAILHNQKGETNKALPLYERALRIYEQHYGRDHPEVAHTLTDLAVLHLEQGRDDVGRPLLERALAIQLKALGPDHPDVLAIKDVLNSE